MNTAAFVKPFAWSYSHIKNFETCPFRYQQIDLLKNIKEPESQQLKEGFEVHKALADRIDHARTLPPQFQQFERWVDYAMKDADRTRMVFGAERRLAITEDFQPCEYFDRIKRVWLRSVADVLRIDGNFCHIIDWKTGKKKPDPDQLKLIALCVMVHYPQVENFLCELVWLAHPSMPDDPDFSSYKFSADDIKKFWNEDMVKRVRELREARATNTFIPKTSGLCRGWCPVHTCEHHRG